MKRSVVCLSAMLLSAALTGCGTGWSQARVRDFLARHASVLQQLADDWSSDPNMLNLSSEGEGHYRLTFMPQKTAAVGLDAGRLAQIEAARQLNPCPGAGDHACVLLQRATNNGG